MLFLTVKRNILGSDRLFVSVRNPAHAFLDGLYEGGGANTELHVSCGLLLFFSLVFFVMRVLFCRLTAINDAKCLHFVTPADSMDSLVLTVNKADIRV